MAQGKFGLNISQGQFQTLRMTPQLQQAIKLLQLSRMEFETAIRKELEENPTLEELGESPDAPDEKVAKESDNTQSLDGTAQDTNFETSVEASQDPTKQDEFDWENYFEPSKPTRDFGPGSDEIMNYENVISTTESLYDHLVWQMNLSGFNDEEYRLVHILISYIDDDGYIKTPLAQIAQDEGVGEQDLEEMLPFLHEFDPAGIGARDLKECLLIQAEHIGEDTHDLVYLINNHLKELEKKNYEAIAKAMNKDLEEVIQISRIIYELEPKPGRAFVPADTQYITPDVYVYKVGEEYVVSLNEDGLPRLRVSNFYRNSLKASGTSKEAQEYIKDKLKAAMFLIKSIHQRQRTIYRVTESIVKHQRDFFELGSEYIKPMILRDIANDIGIHESTVSRVTSNKYVHTARGIFELKYFFNSGINTTSGGTLASESVKQKIKEIVVKEDVTNPISDQKIVEILRKDGIDIARRTVAKYRDMLGILPSSKRKKYF
ncbi:MAG: RNA polymerase sigma-54 factor [Bdellovibrionales bacterium CG10_big_fil_rev_8_21_14_0_10_45_34]|nr:MAG: RNA polymerase sigma-54 factor [Bdellovibrionales bacterium CG10_big_fil_rev_8_21_14_0_10_45_34]